MLQPPVSHLTSWRPGHWITQTGYGLNDADVKAGTKNLPDRYLDMRFSVLETDRILEKVMRK